MGNILLSFLNWFYQAIFNIFTVPLVEFTKMLFEIYGFDISVIISKITFIYDTYIIGYMRFTVSLLHYGLHIPMWIFETTELLIYFFVAFYIFTIPYRQIAAIIRFVRGKFI